MTVCIASACKQQHCLVGITDSMVSTGDMSADNLAIKFISLGSKWVAMYAGNDLSPVTPILKSVRPIVRDLERETLGEVVAAFQRAFRAAILNKAESTILSRFGMDMNDFRSNGLANFGPEIFTRLVYEVEQISLDLTFLVAGFDLEDTAFDHGHIFTIHNRGDVTHYDVPGFWAIGSGQTTALGTLFGMRRTLTYCDLPDSLYSLAKAKFNAETAPGVGKKTVAFVLQRDGSRYLIHDEEFGNMRSIWDEERPVDVSERASQRAQEVIEKAKSEGFKPSTSQKSASAQ